MMLLELKRIHVPPGQRVILQDVTWQELETILEDLGEHRAARIRLFVFGYKSKYNSND